MDTKPYCSLNLNNSSKCRSPRCPHSHHGQMPSSLYKHQRTKIYGTNIDQAPFKDTYKPQETTVHCKELKTQLQNGLSWVTDGQK